MKNLRLLLWPFSVFYWIITSIRNLLYDHGILKSFEIPNKSITVGNLSVGGTGKSPLVDYIVSLGLANDISTSTLSRGYGRRTKGFIEATSNSTSEEIGDEPLLYKLHHQNMLRVFVSEDRTLGVKKIQELYPDNKLIVLDDALQHRKVHAGLSVLVTEYNTPFYRDLIVPAGNLRESKSGVNRADLVLISKCPEKISETEMNVMRSRIKINKDAIFFSTIEYKELLNINDFNEEITREVVLVTGIGNPKPLLIYLEKKFIVHHMKFKDHHHFTESDVNEIHKKINTFDGRCNTVITTEKDFMRLRYMESIRDVKIRWMYQPIEVKIIDHKLFDRRILDYVRDI